jgi:DNA-binding MarR family transcriptional regulator
MIEDVYRSAGHLVRRAHQLHNVLFGELTGGFDVTSPQFAALQAIAEFPGLEQTALSDIIAYDRSTIGGLIDRLEAKGLVARTVGTHDRRTKRLELTADGEALMLAVQPHASQVHERLLEALSPAERELFVALLARVVGIDASVERVRRLQRPGAA